MSWREHARAVVESGRFQQAIIAVIVVNAITLGLETSASARADYGAALHAVDRVALGIFVAELLTKFYVYRWRFFRDPWNVFDFVIVGISLLPASGGLSVLRSLRILRALRLISAIPSMRRVVSALLGAMPGMASIFSLLALVLYVAGVMATKMFGSAAPSYFGDLGTTLFTLFQVMTGEAWPDVARDVMDEHPTAWIFFVVYILASSFVVLNLFIAVVVSAMEEYEDEVHEVQEKEIEREIGDSTGAVLAELRSLRAEIRSLRAAQDAGMVAVAGRQIGVDAVPDTQPVTTTAAAVAGDANATARSAVASDARQDDVAGAGRSAGAADGADRSDEARAVVPPPPM